MSSWCPAGVLRFIILACDGLFKVFSADEAVKFVLAVLQVLTRFTTFACKLSDDIITTSADLTTVGCVGGAEGGA